MKPNLNNQYGYKVCYTEKHNKKLYEKFLTKTYKQAKKIKEGYLIYPPKPIIRPTWYIIPITKKEVQEGIWNKAPFD